MLKRAFKIKAKMLEPFLLALWYSSKSHNLRKHMQLGAVFVEAPNPFLGFNLGKAIELFARVVPMV